MIWRRIGRRPAEDIRTMGVLFPAVEAAALADGENTAGAEYLVIAALDLQDGSARRAFERAGGDPDAFRVAVQDQHADALRGVGIQPINGEMLDQHLPTPVPAKGPVKTAPSAHKLFRKIVKKVRKERSQLYGAYFVLAAAETEHGTTARAIRHMGIEPATLAQAARTEIDLLRNPST